jgi:hypothetical protein
MYHHENFVLLTWVPFSLHGCCSWSGLNINIDVRLNVRANNAKLRNYQYA